MTGGRWYAADPAKTEAESASTGSQTNSVLTEDLPAGTYYWRIRSLFAGSIWSAWSAEAAFTVVAPPAVGAVTVDAGLSPEVSWTIESGSQTYCQVTILDAADEAVYTSGLVLAGTASWTVPIQDDWVNGGTYRAVVQITAADGMTSTAKTSDPFVVSWVAPAAPTGLDLAAGSPPTAQVTGLGDAALLRLSWETSAGQPVVGTWSVTGDTMDVSLPVVPYASETEVVAQRSDPTGLLWSDPVSATVTSFDVGAYLADDDMTSWLSVIVAKDDEVKQTEGVTVAYPLGAFAPIVVRSDSAGDSGVVTLVCRTQAEKQALRAWLKDRGILWLRRFPERNVLTGGLADVPATRLSMAASWSEERISDAPVQQRLVSIPWVERP